jgi:Protein of unknown function (DUF4031)
MAVYVDAAIWTWSGLKWCHLLADDLDELHRFAALLGIMRASFQCPPKAATPHYDLTGYERAKAIALGAVVCNREQIIAVRRRIMLQPNWSPHGGRDLPKADGGRNAGI